MAAIDDITALAQSIYLAKNNRYNDVDGEELTDFLNQTIDWVNQFLEELELEADWNYLRVNDNLISEISDTTTQTFELPEDIRKLVVSPYRDATIKFDGTTVSTFEVVNPDQIADPRYPSVADRLMTLGENVIISRAPTTSEVGGELRADTIRYMPKLALNDVDVLSLVKPYQLIVLGVAKNATLPDIVQGGISPSLAQKYSDLLLKAVSTNNATAAALETPGEDFGFIRGVW